MNNKTVVIFFIISILIHTYVLFFMKFEPFKDIKKKQEKYTVVDLIEKKIKQKPVKKKPKTKLLAEKDIDLKKKSEKKVDTKKPPTIKKPVQPKIEKPTVKTEQKPVEKKTIVKKETEKKVVKEKVNKKEVGLKKKVEKKEKPVKKKPIKKAEKKIVKKKEAEVKKQVKPFKESKKLPKSLADLNTKDIIEGFSKEDAVKSDKGDDVIDLQAVEYKYASYFSKFKRLVENNWNYPRPAAMRGQQGSVRVSFSILKDGTITDLKFLNSSGYPLLDREVKRLLTEMKAYPLPKSWKKDRIKIEGNFIYKLYGGYILGRFE